MFFQSHRLSVTLTALVVLTWVAVPLTAQIPQTATDGALALAAQDLGTAQSELSVIASRQVDLPQTGVTVYSFKIGTSDGSAVTGVVVDAAGAEQDLDALLAAEQAAGGGSMSPDFESTLASAAPEDRFPVGLWIKLPFEPGLVQRPDPKGKGVSNAQIEEIFEHVDARRRQRVAAATRGVVQRLQRRGFEPRSGELAPMVFAELPAAEILELAASNEVLRVEPVPRFEPSLDVLKATVHGHVVHHAGLGGGDVQTAAIEVGGQIDTANPFLGCVEQDTLFSCLNPHAAAVAGVLCSSDYKAQGVAPDARLWMGGSCFGFGDELVDRSEAAATWGARVFNLSYGADFGGFLSEFDAFYDDQVINGYRTVVAAAGNNAPFGGYVNTPATAYNVITVGSYDDQGTVTWLDDTVSDFTSWKGPSSANSDREKPEVVAPGTDILSTTNASPWTGPVGDGTSYSAPAVAAGAALLMERDPTLETWPESVKAILMATAVHNVEGDPRLSEFDGAGGVAIDRAEAVVRGQTGSWSGLGYSCGSATFLNLGSIYINAGQRLRAVIAWDNDPAYSLYDSQPGADLDLRLYDPFGFIATRSVSYDNTYEIVDFTAPFAGFHDLVVVKFRCDYSPQWLGWAFHWVD